MHLEYINTRAPDPRILRSIYIIYVIYWVHCTNKYICTFVKRLCREEVGAVHFHGKLFFGRAEYNNNIVARRVKGPINHAGHRLLCRPRQYRNISAYHIYTHIIYLHIIMYVCARTRTRSASTATWCADRRRTFRDVLCTKLRYNLSPPRNPFWPDNNGRRTMGWWIYWFMSSEIAGHTECSGKKRTKRRRRRYYYYYVVPHIVGNGFICVYNKFFQHNIPGVRVKQTFCLRVSSAVASLYTNGGSRTI